jgi:Tfp pilus assembly protein PilF
MVEICGYVKEMRLIVGMISASCGVLNAGSLLDFSYGILESLHGDDSRANGYFESAYAADPTAMPLVNLMVRMKMESGDKLGAIGIYEKVISERPDATEIRIEYGDFLGTIGRGDALADRKREAAYQAVWEAMPGQVLPTERLIRFAREKGDDDKARAWLEKLDLDSQEAVNLYVTNTKSLYDSKDEAAQRRIADCFRKALGDHPEWAGTARAASEYFREAGNLKEALRMLEIHTTAVPSSLDLRIRKGILHFVAKEDEAGIKALKDVLIIHSRKALAHESLAKYYRKSGRMDEALYHSAELLKIRGGTPEEFEQLATDLLHAGKSRDARLLLEKAVYNHPDNVRLMTQLAVAAVRDPESKHSALRLCREAENMMTEPSRMDPDFLLEFARELVAQGQNKAAEERLRNAIKTFPKTATRETADALRALAGIWNAEGRNADAARALISRAEALEK